MQPLPAGDGPENAGEDFSSARWSLGETRTLY
jgi:hypothetical protein